MASHISDRLLGLDKILGPSFLATLGGADQGPALEALVAWSEFRTRKKVGVNATSTASFRFEVEQNMAFEVIAMNIANERHPGDANAQYEAFAAAHYAGMEPSAWHRKRIIAALARWLIRPGYSPDPDVILRWVGAYFDWQARGRIIEANPGFPRML